MSENPNIGLIIKLEELYQYYEQIGDKFRTKAYAKAITTIQQLKTRIKSGRDAKKLPGIGTSIADKIDEFLKTGTIGKIEQLKHEQVPIPEIKQETTDKQAILDLFQSIYGVGPVTAEKWYNKGHRTYDHLVNEKMTRAQMLGYKYFKEYTERIPRQHIEEIENVFRKTLPQNINFLFCGSYRRGLETCGDVDVLFHEHKTFTINDIIDCLSKVIHIEKLSGGQHKFSGLCRLTPESRMCRLDLMIINADSWPYATLYFTGSYQLNIQMRDKARQLGWRLNEYGMSTSDHKEFSHVTTELEIFNLLDIPYLEPHQRSLL